PMTTEAREIYVDPAAVDPARRAEVGETLAKELGLPRREIDAKLAQTDKRYLVVARDAAPDVAKRILARGFAGVGAKHRYARLYPGDDLAGSLMGFVGDDGKGLSGIESAYDEVLRGRDGLQSVEVGANGQRIP